MPDLSPKQISAVEKLLQRICPSLGLALSEQLNREVVLDLSEARTVSLSELLSRSENALQTQFTLSQPEGCESVMLISEETARILVNLMEGTSEDTPEALTEAQVDTLSMGMSGLARGFAVALTNLTDETYEIESSSTHVGMLTVPPVFALEGSAVEVRFSLVIPDVLNAELTGLFTGSLMAELIPASEGRSNPAQANQDGALSEDDVAAMLNQVGGGSYEQVRANTMGMGPEIGASNPFSSMLVSSPETALPRGLEMILDIPLDVTVELGRVRMLIKDVLELSAGSIVELDRVAGEPVDLLVNGKLVAKGEVVVIEDNFGIRITEITSPAERLAGLGKGR